MHTRFVPVPVLLALAIGLGAGCSAFRMSVEDRNPRESNPLSAKYDQEDLLSLAELTAEALLAHPFPPAEAERPILVEMGIQNRTETHIDMQALSNTITTHMLDGKTV
jgi:PBP1b-binding outer membrane lipoprotein LpoB